ncbi:cobalt ABC transporter permease [Clostridium polyendosporum]|uniref:Cobalt ABC transporter permease n=1 Tax=Clostridium polyendosporum TaxID=69208 RepID=A0A919RZN2_9CLOT|nr:CbiQ family ECF transporter T component [Clostridium polyendosporum]GIM28558.1 cobalt ABC transporter permease [Clostridium polyendosporum]
MFKIILLYSKISKFSHINPIEKLVFCICCLIINSFSKNVTVPIINIIVFIVLNIIARNPLKYLVKLTLGMFIFSVFSSITLVFDYGINFSMLLIVKTISSTLCLLFLSFTTPLDDILYYLYKINIARDVCDIIKSTEKFLILIEDEYYILYNSIKSRGGFETKFLIIKNTARLAALLLVNSMKRWSYIKDALNSRCYNGYMPYIRSHSNLNYGRFTGMVTYIVCMVIIILK